MSTSEVLPSQEVYDRWMELAKESFWAHVGCNLETISNDKAVISLQVEKHHQNVIGIVHGGVHATLLDSAMGLLAMLPRIEADVVTINLNVSYVASAGEGKIIVEAETIHSSRRLVTLQASARTEAGELLAFGTGTFRVIERK